MNTPKTNINDVITEDSKFIQCDCINEGLLITSDSELKLIFLAMYGYGVSYRPKPSIWDRTKYAFSHLRTGKYYHDELILTHDKAKEMVEYISTIVNK